MFSYQRWHWFQFQPHRGQIGYLNAGLAEGITCDLDQGWRVSARVKEITGGFRGKPTLGVNVEMHLEQDRYHCPISGCQKVFYDTRRGWEGHVGRKKAHPQWHPDMTAPEARKSQFKAEFPNWL